MLLACLREYKSSRSNFTNIRYRNKRIPFYDTIIPDEFQELTRLMRPEQNLIDLIPYIYKHAISLEIFVQRACFNLRFEVRFR